MILPLGKGLDLSPLQRKSHCHGLVGSRLDNLAKLVSSDIARPAQDVIFANPLKIPSPCGISARHIHMFDPKGGSASLALCWTPVLICSCS